MDIEEFKKLYPDSDNEILAKEMGVTVERIRCLAVKHKVKKSRMHESTRARRSHVLNAMRGEFVWATERKELYSLAVCLENYDRINSICDNFTGRKKPPEMRKVKRELTESSLESMIEELYKRMAETDIMSEEARRISAEIRDRSLKLYMLRRRKEEKIDSPIESEYVILSLG